MAHLLKNRKPLLARIRRIQGQLRALEALLDTESGTECGQVLQQIAAVRGAVGGLMNHVLEGHVREHLGAEQADPQQRAEDVERLLSVMRSYLR
ncbi:MAG: metal/formaldehyde-sensitive transcriptional repressor [Candidatus Dactylopiibacterium sp.]|nr:metal/formaldehyde-sensitive transcriptional repressor [Candidatus Dactylopiibacterium sp.]